VRIYTNASENGTLIITERRIIIYLCSFMGGIIGLLCLGDGWLWGIRLMQINGAAICLMPGMLVLFIWVYLRGQKIVVIEPFISALFCGAAGELTIYRRLSAFLMDMAALRLGRQKFSSVMNFASINCGGVRRLPLC